MGTGFFITFEGGEGAGKTTQINRLSAALVKRGYQVVTTREPGGTAEAEKIRDLIVQRDGGAWTAMAEVLLLFAARHLHVERVIAPAIRDGKVVICDRFTDSTLAYQGYGHDLDLSVIEDLKRIVIDGLEPDMTFILDIDPELGLKRSERRLASESLSIKQKEDRFESMDFSFHERLRQGFLSIAKDNPERCIVCDATQDLDVIVEQIAKDVQTRLDAHS